MTDTSPVLVTFGVLKKGSRWVGVALETQGNRVVRQAILAAGKRPAVLDAARKARADHFTTGWSIFDELDLSGG